MTRKQIEAELRKFGYNGRQLKRLTKIELEAHHLVVLMKQKKMVTVGAEAIEACNESNYNRAKANEKVWDLYEERRMAHKLKRMGRN